VIARVSVRPPSLVLLTERFAEHGGMQAVLLDLLTQLGRSSSEPCRARPERPTPRHGHPRTPDTRHGAAHPATSKRATLRGSNSATPIIHCPARDPAGRCERASSFPVGTAAVLAEACGSSGKYMTR
jgi:hypothetical protein